MRRRRPDLQERRPRIKQVRNALTRQHFTPAFMPRARFLTATKGRNLGSLAHGFKGVEVCGFV
jgi:hypothetical protein